MAETYNISEIADQISSDIFARFNWRAHPKRNDNFPCVNGKHKSTSGLSKHTHPGDVVFHYEDPYLQKRVYLHTDLKSYADASITSTMLKSAFQSLCMSIECANQSNGWREKYSVDPSEVHEVRGLLFVHNYTKGYAKPFHDTLAKVNLKSLPISPRLLMHFLGPHDIHRLYSIGNDIMRLKSDGELSEDYTFYYPDLTLFRRQGDGWGQAATIETLTGPYIVIKHRKSKATKAGYLIYFNRPDPSPAALEYFLDSLSRYQMLESGERIRVRCTHSATVGDIKSRFETAKQRYAKAWGFEPSRIKILQEVEISTITSVTDTYNPGATGWRE